MRFVPALLACAALLGGSPALGQIEKVEVAPGLKFPVVTKTPQELATLLESKDVKVRQEAVKALFFLKWYAAPALPALIKALKDPDVDVRGFAAGCFCYFGPPVCDPGGAVPILAEMLNKDTDANVRAICAASLRHLTKIDKKLIKSVTPFLLKALDDKDKWVRARAAGALGILGEGGQKPFQVIAVLLGDADDEVQDMAIGALGEVGLPALPTLMACLQDKAARVRAAAGRGIVVMIEKVQSKKQIIPKEIIPPLTKALEDSDAEVVVRAISSLGLIGPAARDSIPGIIKCLKHKDSWVRMVAANYLPDFGSDAKISIPALTEALKDEHGAVRNAAEKALKALAK